MQNWWNTYFSDVWEPMAHLIKTPEDTVRECEFIDQVMQEYGLSSLLDMPCGAGRIALEMAKQGYQTTGADANPSAIEKAQAKTAKMRKNKPTFTVADMRTFTSDRLFDMSVCAYNSFGYFSDSDNEAFVASVSKALAPGGFWLLENHVLETLLPVFTPKEYWQFGNFVLLEERTIDYHNSRLVGNWTLIMPDGSRKSYQSSVRIYSYRELIALLKKHGFTQFSAYSSYYAEPFEFGADMLLLLAQK